MECKKICLTAAEKKLVEELGDSTYTVDYLEAWINRNDSVEINAVAALSAMGAKGFYRACLLYTSPSPRDNERSRMPSSA